MAVSSNAAGSLEEKAAYVPKRPPGGKECRKSFSGNDLQNSRVPIREARLLPERND
jgi:hypothetical protein